MYLTLLAMTCMLISTSPYPTEASASGFCHDAAALTCNATCLCRAGCYWSIETEADQRFVEITIEKGADEDWKQILDTDSSVSAKAKVTDHVYFDIEEVRLGLL